MANFVIAVNPEENSSLPYLVKLPVEGGGSICLKVRDAWPRTSKVYCHPTDWPEKEGSVEIVESVPVKSCKRRGAVIDLVLDRYRENRSQFVFAKGRGREMVFWQSARTSKQARPQVRTPTAKSTSGILDIVVDTGEKYAWKFSKQQANTMKEKLVAGDYAVKADDEIVATVERKSLEDLKSTITGGKLWYMLSNLETIKFSVVVIEDRYSSVFKMKHVKPLTIAEGIAEAAVRYPKVPLIFCENRQLAQEYTYRYLGEALHQYELDKTGTKKLEELKNC